MKRAISLELKDKCVDLYQQVLLKKETDAIAVAKIKELCKNEGEIVSERTIYRYLDEWKKDLTISSVIESYEVDLTDHSSIAKDAMKRFYRRFITEDEKEKPNERALSQWAIHLKDFIDISVKVEVLKSKKTTNIATGAEAAKIVIQGDVNGQGY